MAIRLPMLRTEPGPDLVDRVEIATPCEVSWDSMYGDERVRHCGSCRHNVYNVAELTRAQALELIARRERVCLRIYRRPDGTVVTADCWSRLRAARKRGVWAFVAMLIIVGWAQLAAMFVGISGLRRLIAKPTMGSVTAPERIMGQTLLVKPAPPPVPLEPITVGHMRPTMGEMIPSELDPPAVPQPAQHKKVKKFPSEVGHYTAGRIRVR